MTKTQAPESDSSNTGNNVLVEFVMSIGKAVLVFQPDLIALAWIFAAAGLSVSNWFGNNNFFWIKGWDLLTSLLFVGITLIMAGANLFAQNDQHANGEQSLYPNIEARESIRNAIPRLAPALIIIGYALIIPSGILAALAGLLAVILLWMLYGINTILWRDNKAVQSALHILVGLLFFAVGWGRGSASVLEMFPLIVPYLMILITLSITVVFALAETSTISKQLGQLLVGVGLLLLLVAIVTAFIIGDPLGSTVAALMAPFYVVALIRGERIDILRCFRYSLLVITIFTGARYPYLFLPVLALFYLSRFYQLRTRGIAFPTLEGPEWSAGVAESSVENS